MPEAGLEPFVPRVTFTFPLIAKAKRVVVLATGESKADAVAKAFGPDAKPDPHVPSSLLAGQRQGAAGVARPGRGGAAVN